MSARNKQKLQEKAYLNSKLVTPTTELADTENVLPIAVDIQEVPKTTQKTPPKPTKPTKKGSSKKTSGKRGRKKKNN